MSDIFHKRERFQIVKDDPARQTFITALKAELEMPSQDDIDDLRAKLVSITTKYNELIDFLRYGLNQDDAEYMTCLKVAEP